MMDNSKTKIQVPVYYQAPEALSSGFFGVVYSEYDNSGDGCHNSIRVDMLYEE